MKFHAKLLQQFNKPSTTALVYLNSKHIKVVIQDDIKHPYRLIPFLINELGLPLATIFGHFKGYMEISVIPYTTLLIHNQYNITINKKFTNSLFLDD